MLNVLSVKNGILRLTIIRGKSDSCSAECLLLVSSLRGTVFHFTGRRMIFVKSHSRTIFSITAITVRHQVSAEQAILLVMHKTK